MGFAQGHFLVSDHGLPHPLENEIFITFACARTLRLADDNKLTVVQNHIIKFILDQGITRELFTYLRRSLITGACELQMLPSKQFKEEVVPHRAHPDMAAFTK